MKPLVKKFFRRGLMAAAGGPVILAIVYACLERYGVIGSLSVGEVVRGILTVTLMAFIAGGIPVVYEAERLSLMSATLIHAVSLYADYILIYLFNGWLKHAYTPILIFTLIFFVGYGVIWLFIFRGVKSSVDRMNRGIGETE